MVCCWVKGGFGFGFWLIAWVKNDLAVGNLAMRSDFLGSVFVVGDCGGKK